MTAIAAPATCLLLVGDRVVLRASGPPEAEYAMFEIGDIELRASEPGRVREHGYQTTAEQARTRLGHLGITPVMARELADAMQPVLSDAYARGGAARRVARYLGPVELFQSDGYEAREHAYRGVFLDLAALARDLALNHASATLHALYLAMVLEREADETTILLSTDACTKGAKPGARTYKRPSFADRQRLLNAVGGLSHKASSTSLKAPRPEIEDVLPRADVIAFLRARAEMATDEDSRALYHSLEATVAQRDMPEKGPLASPDLWAIEKRIDAGDLNGTLPAIDDAERRHGRTPGTTYLRARVSLLTRLEPPRVIAERVSALALSMTSFQELALLASESWLEAGDPWRSMPYARDLVDSPGVDEGLLLRAQRVLARAVGAAPQTKQTLGASPSVAARPSHPPQNSNAYELVLSDRPRAMSDRPRAMSDRPRAMSDKPVTLDLELHPFDAARSVPPLEAPSRSLEPDDLVPALATPLPPSPAIAPSPPARPSRGAPPPLPSSRPSSPLRSAPPLRPSSREEKAAASSASEPPARMRSDKPSLPPLPNASPILLPPNASPVLLPPNASPSPPAREPSTPTPPLAVTPAEAFGGAEKASLGEFSLDDAPLTQGRRERPSSMPPARRPAAAEPPPHAPPPLELDLNLTPVDAAASFTLDLPGPETLPAGAPPPEQARPSRRPRMTGVMMETRPPTAYDPRAEPDGPIIPRVDTSLAGNPVRDRSPVPEARPAPARRASVPSPSEIEEVAKPAQERPTPMRPPSNDSPLSTSPTANPDDRGERHEPPTPTMPSVLPPEARSFMHGASLPPYRHENPAPLLLRAPLLPRLGGTSDELAEHLPLPPGLGGEGQSLDVLPTSVLEARVQFTLLSRELGLDFRLKRGIDLRADVSGIEAMQSVLLESFPDRAVRSSDEAYELRRHGALLSEILARRLDAEWLDISPNELGYWVMIVPPDTRVWPFGRVARLVAMGHKERDLVSYFLELQSRARGR